MAVNSLEQQHGERIAALEASYQHLATKSDISQLRLELEQSVNQLQANIDALKWVIMVAIAGARRCCIGGNSDCHCSGAARLNGCAASLSQVTSK